MAKRVSIDYAKSVGGRLTELRKELKLHQSDMAKKMGISERVYRRYEGGEMVPGSDKLTALFEDMKDVNSMWLLMGAGRMFKSLGEPQRNEAILDIVASNPTIERIVILLKGLDDEDLKETLSRVSEKKRLKDLHTN